MLRVFVLVVVLGCVLTSSSVCTAQVYYVKPSQPPNTTCPGEPCHTLNYYAQNTALLLSRRSNVTLLFVEGVHLLTESCFEVFETERVTLSALTEYINATVMLSTGSDMNFTFVDDLLFSNLVIVAALCPSNSIPGNSINSTLVRRFCHSNVTVFCCTFNLQMIREIQLYQSTYNNAGINMFNFDEMDNVILMFSKCCFLNNAPIDISLNSSFNGSITNSSGVVINFNVINRGFFSLTIRDCVNGPGDFGEVGVVVSEAPYAVRNKLFELILENNHFETHIFNFPAPNNADFERFLFVKNCSFHHALFISEAFFSDISMYLSNFYECSVDFRSAKVCTVRNVSFDASSFNVMGPSTVLIDSCRFEKSIELDISPFIMSEVCLLMVNETVFKNNQGYHGGALYLYNSRLYLTHNSVLVFENNSAIDKGGAVYVDNPVDERFVPNGDSPTPSECVFSLKYNVTDGIKPDNVIIFKDNSAASGGSNIYGASIKSDCLVSPDGRNASYEVQADFFEFDDNSKTNRSSVSSDPKRVCLCDDNGIPMCANISYIMQYKKVAPGEKFNVSLALVGDDFGVTVGSVYATLFQGNEYPSLRINDLATKTLSSAECLLEEYVIYSDTDNVTRLLFLSSHQINNNMQYLISGSNSIRRYEESNEIDYYLATTNILLNITLQKCPIGFILNKTNGSCQCIQTLTDIDVTKCVIFNGEGLITRSGTIWVSHSGVVDDKTPGVVAYKYCPFNYCKTEEIFVKLYEPDSQCAFDHSGVLCGGCSPKLSLALGSPQCLPCSDNGHVAFFILFAIAGIVLVLFIKLLDLTITKGAVNGLLLYANILWTNQSIFFPRAIRQSSSLFHFFTTFVAWLNLDLGIETCFIQGLDMYWKTWLQFLFPLYIWSLAGLIILACRYSDKATKIFGNNSVHVLATLFLLSYSKLLRTIITSLGVAILDYPGVTRIVWLADGNLPYFGGHHSLLFIAAIFALIVFWLPYTVTILFVPWLKKCGNISWVNKLKPFFDAHYGPLKDKHQYWIGLTLLARVILAITNVAIQAIDPTVNLLVIIALSSLLLYVVAFSYKRWYLSFLEASFVANVIILGGGFQHSSNQQFQAAFAIISVGIAFLTFLLIICVQGYTQLKTLIRCKTGVRREYENITSINDSKTECVPPTHSVVSLYDDTTPDYFPLRESLLESDTY